MYRNKTYTRAAEGTRKFKVKEHRHYLNFNVTTWTVPVKHCHLEGAENFNFRSDRPRKGLDSLLGGAITTTLHKQRIRPFLL